ncbi:MAG TPA: serine/threonine-protein kinase [Gemmatimonadales bacterium]|nr:serine/threonine-protein kinase [Gemmatimonadales bacterium]
MSDLRSRLQAVLAERYAIDRELGRGGMSLVYLARDRRHDRPVALKVLRPELGASLGPERFLREIKVAAGLTHPHILPLFDSGEADGLLFYVMPYVEGESLRQRLDRQGPLALGEALRIAREVADALDYAHRRDIVHRDIKPENILLQDGHAVVSDFGIARAISAAGGGRVTQVGIAVGTPDYMSPEQASGEDEVDGRSDIYSLGCVLYEMLAGRTPFPGLTPTAALGAHRAERPPSVSGARADTPVEVVLAIEMALAKLPGERFRSAADFAAALTAPAATISGTWRKALRRRWGVGVAVALGLAGLAIGVVPGLLGAGPDESLYVVVPFGHRSGAAPRLLNGDQCEMLLYDAFRRWEDVPLVNDLQVHDFRLRQAEQPPTLRDALALARKFGAGRLIWGEVAEFGDTIHVRATLYDVKRRGAPVREYQVRLGAGDPDVASKFAELADSLLAGRAGSPEAGGRGTRVFAALQAYERGHEARARWDLAGAEAGFRRALELDPTYAQASLWLAQTLGWEGRPAGAWRTYAAAAASAVDRLGARDRALAGALLHLADGQFAEACDGYRHLVAQDSSDFIAWFGLGECQRRDRRVVPDPASRSAWRFRSSYRAAAAAYRRALELVPSAHRAFAGVATQRLTDLFFAEPYVFRAGYALAPDTLSFAAFPSIDRDTLAFVPWPIADVMGGKPAANPPSMHAAVERNREVLRGIVEHWVEAFPGSADAHESLGLVLEAGGDVAAGGVLGRSALLEVRSGRGLTHDPEQALRLAVTEVRLLTKVQQFEPARSLADSILTAAAATPGPAEARRLAGLAALTGRAHRTSQLLRLSAPVDTPTTWSGEAVADAPLPVKQAALALLGYAALGAPAESLRTLKARVDQSVRSWAGPATRERLRLAVLHVPLALAFPVLGLTDVHRADAGGDYLLELQWALTRGDTTRVRAELARIAALRSAARPGDVAMDGTYHEAWLLLQLGDTAAATQLLDLSLDALPTLGSALLDQVPQAGALVQGMALRADLAARAGDRTTAARWARAVATLWAGADPPLEPILQRMRSLKGRPPW